MREKIGNMPAQVSLYRGKVCRKTVKARSYPGGRVMAMDVSLMPVSHPLVPLSTLLQCILLLINHIVAHYFFCLASDAGP